MFSLDAWDDAGALAAAWRAAQPFPHLVLDGLVAPSALPELLELLEEESIDPYESDLFRFEASAPEPRTAALRELRSSFAAALAPRLSRIGGRDVRRADMRAFAYRPGHFLLPHTDHREELGRIFAYAYYLPSPAPPVGGELELFRCEIAGAGGERDGGGEVELATTESARVIEPRGNRIVVFEVGATSLHQVREVLDGLRISLAGWFYP